MAEPLKTLILGNGAAGLEAALMLRKHDSETSITLLTESRWLHYFRPKLVHFLAEAQSPEDLVVYDEAFYQKKNIYNVLGRKVASVDTSARQVTDELGGVYPYDRLLIATGSRPFVPPIEGIDKDGVFTLRSITDAQKIRRYSENVQKTVVIGGGLLGLENAFSLQQLGKAVTVIEFAPWLLPRQLDQNGGAHLQKLLEAKGLEFLLNAQVERIVGGSHVEGVQLKDGRFVACGAVLVSAGVRGDMDFLKGTPIATNRGIIVDDRMRTNVEGIWAAGDVAEHRGLTYGLWTVAREQGQVAGADMAGQPTEYTGSLPSSLLKITGINVFSMGDVRASGSYLSGGNDESYKKLVVDKDQKPVAAMVVGDKSAITTAQKIMGGKAPAEDFKKHL
jgi:nitrite reductase (NADH) large subunit